MSELQENILNLRQDYSKAELDIGHVAEDPFTQFGKWMQEALDAEVNEANAMSVATVGADGRPSLRILLLRGFDEAGFRFFTNYDSRKGQELALNPHCALTFFWPELERQVRIEGTVGKTSAEESDAYFHSRPRGNRLGAWASPQSRSLPDRESLENMVTEFQEKYEGKEPPRPENWGGYRLVPNKVEFWQGRPSRLHDRIRFTRAGELWKIVRLAP